MTAASSHDPPPLILTAIVVVLAVVATPACDATMDGALVDSSVDALAEDDASIVHLPNAACGGDDEHISGVGLVRGFDGPVLHVARVRQGDPVDRTSELYAVGAEGTLRRLPAERWVELGDIVHVLSEHRYVRTYCRSICSISMTLDGGRNWAPLWHPNGSGELASHASSLFQVSGDQLAASDDGGESWNSQSALPFAPRGLTGMLVDDDGRAVVWDADGGAAPRLARREADGSATVVSAPCNISSAVPADGGLLVRCAESTPGDRAILMDESLHETAELDATLELRAFGNSAVVLDETGTGTRVLDVSAPPPYPVLATIPFDRVPLTLSLHDKLYWVAQDPGCGGGGLVVGVLSR